MNENRSEQGRELQELWARRTALNETQREVFISLCLDAIKGFQIPAYLVCPGDHEPNLGSEFIEKLLAPQDDAAPTRPDDGVSLAALERLFLEHLVNRRLTDLWCRRAQLSNPEWTAFWRLTHAVLDPIRFPHYQSCREEHPSDLIDQFFSEKVAMPALGPSDQSIGVEKQCRLHAAALVLFYKRFLVSCIRRRRTTQIIGTLPAEVEPGADADDEQRPEPSDDAPPEAERKRVGAAPDSSGQAAESTGAAETPGPAQSTAPGQFETSGAHQVFVPETPPAPDDSGSEWDGDYFANVLEIPWEAAERAASQFYWTRGPWHVIDEDGEWMRLYLSRSWCPQKEHPDALPLYKLAKRCAISDYHVKAQTLGISAPRRGFGSLEDFRETYLGEWVCSLGPLTYARVDAALQILCAVSLMEHPRCKRELTPVGAVHV